MTTNAYEARARAAKADGIAQWLIRRGFATDTVIANAATPLWRSYVAKRAGWREASDETWAAVVGLLQARDQVDR